MYYILMCSNVSAILWVFNDILMLIMFTKEQREEFEKKDDEEMHDDPAYGTFMRIFGFTTDTQMAIFLFILGTYVPGLNVIFWKGIITSPFEYRKRV